MSGFRGEERKKDGVVLLGFMTGFREKGKEKLRETFVLCSLLSAEVSYFGELCPMPYYHRVQFS
jgi:hypothetical protein